MKLEDMEIYQLAMKIGEKVWNIVDSWEWFAKKSIGFQFVESTDSIAANISEGYGRYHFKQRMLFMYYSLWNQKLGLPKRTAET